MTIQPGLEAGQGRGVDGAALETLGKLLRLQRAAGAAAAGEEKTVFAVHLASSGAQKIAVIKVVKELLALGLKEAKDLVDAAPALLKDGVKKEDAENIKKQIEAAGGKVELK